jgi:hypothetical protein
MAAHADHTPHDLMVTAYRQKWVTVPLCSMLHDQQHELCLYEVEQLDNSSQFAIYPTSQLHSMPFKLLLQGDDDLRGHAHRVLRK